MGVVSVDVKLLEEAKAATGIQSDRDVVEEGLRVMLQQLRLREKVRALRGKVSFVDEPEEARGP